MMPRRSWGESVTETNGMTLTQRAEWVAGAGNVRTGGKSWQAIRARAATHRLGSFDMRPIGG